LFKIVFSTECCSVYAAGKSEQFVDGSPCSFVAVIDMAFMVYFNFFGCVLAPLVAMFAMYSYIYSIVRRHIARIAAVMPAVGQSASSTSHDFTTPVRSSSVEMTVPTARQG